MGEITGEIDQQRNVGDAMASAMSPTLKVALLRAACEDGWTDAEGEMADHLRGAQAEIEQSLNRKERNVRKDPSLHCFREDNCAEHAAHQGDECCCCGAPAEVHEGCDCD